MREVSKRECFLDCIKIAVEFPAAVYNAKFSSGSLTPLAAVSGACMALFEQDKKRIFPVYPTVWNGGKKKENIARIIQDLIGEFSEWEFDNKPTRKADFEHVIDAVGMAYWLADREYFEGEKDFKKSGLN